MCELNVTVGPFSNRGVDHRDSNIYVMRRERKKKNLGNIHVLYSRIRNTQSWVLIS